MDTQANGANPQAHGPERGPDGRFVKGNKGGPGNPFARRVAAIRKALLDAVSEDDVQAIVTKLVELAKTGDVAAAKLVLAYAVGKPPQAPDPDTLDLDEWQLFGQANAPGDEVSGLFKGVPLELALDIARGSRAALVRDVAVGMSAALKADDEDAEVADDLPAGQDDVAGAVFDQPWLDRVLGGRPSPGGPNGKRSRERKPRASANGRGTLPQNGRAAQGP